MSEPQKNDDNKDEQPKPARSELSLALARYGSYAVGFLGAVGALVFAYLMPASREKIIGAASSIAILTLLFSNGKYWAYRAIGMLGAGCCAAAALFMPDQANHLLSMSGTIAVLTILFW